MGVHVLYEGNYQQLDCLRSRFFWQGTNKKRKYHMVKWEALNRPKDFGVLGFKDVRVMNSCLMCKWIDRLERGIVVFIVIVEEKGFGTKDEYLLD